MAASKVAMLRCVPMVRSVLPIAFSAVLLGATACTSAHAQPVEEFYRGRTLSLVLGFSTGGLNDIAGRLVAQHLGRFIPGHPRIVAQNMFGAGGLVAANHLYNVAPRDGSVLGGLDRNTPQTGIRGGPNVKFDAAKFTWLGNLSNYDTDAYPLWVDARYPAMTAADINRQPRPTRLGATGGGTNMLISLLAKEALKLNLQVIRGYTGGPNIMLAVERGELDGLTIGFNAVIAEQPEKWQQHLLRPLIQFGREARLPVLASVPTAREVAPDAGARALVEFAELPFLISQPFLAPPDLPADRAAALQDAFRRMVKDPEFIADATRRRVELSPNDDKALLAVIRRAAATPRNVIDQFNAFVGAAN